MIIGLRAQWDFLYKRLLVNEWQVGKNTQLAQLYARTMFSEFGKFGIQLSNICLENMDQ